MYLFFLIILLLVSIFLIFLILLQPGKGLNNNVHLHSSNNIKVFNTIGNSNLITNIISFFAFLFLIISIILCNINDKKIHSDFFWENTKNNTISSKNIFLNKKELKIYNTETFK